MLISSPLVSLEGYSIDTTSLANIVSVLVLSLTTKDCSVDAGPIAAIGQVPIVTSESSDAFLTPIVMLPVGLPYFLNLTKTDLIAAFNPDASESNRTPTLPIPLNALCPGEAP